MPASVGLDADGRPADACAALQEAGRAAARTRCARRCATGSSVEGEGKAESLFLAASLRAARLAEGLQAALDDALADLPIPKVMQYQLADGWTSVEFVRPAHGLVALHGADVVPVHGARPRRRPHDPGPPLRGARPRDRAARRRQLRRASCATRARCIASFAERRAEIVRQLARRRRPRQGLAPIDDAGLLDEVTALVERPNVLPAQFEPEFLAVPPDAWS